MRSKSCEGGKVALFTRRDLRKGKNLWNKKNATSHSEGGRSGPASSKRITRKTTPHPTTRLRICSRDDSGAAYEQTFYIASGGG